MNEEEIWGRGVSHDTIPTEEILKDVADTEAEIVVMKQEMKALRMMYDRMSHFRADARETGIKEREAFIAKLKEILKGREPAQ